jgi:hypothetical protein
MTEIHNVIYYFIGLSLSHRNTLSISQMKLLVGTAFLADMRDLCHNEIISFCLRKVTKKPTANGFTEEFWPSEK